MALSRSSRPITGRRSPHGRPPLASLWEFAAEFGLLCFLGLIVAVSMIPLLHLEPVHAIDRVVSDLVVRQLARDQLAAPQGNPPRLVYIDFSEETCVIWAEQEGTSCTLGMITPREHLIDIINNLIKVSDTVANKPRLVAVDVELAPMPRSGGQANDMDDALCAAVVELAQQLPVVVLRPVTIGRDPRDPLMRAYASIFDPAFSDPARCGTKGLGAGSQLWFASPVLQPDPDGVIRSVHAWDTIYEGSASRRLPGIGFLSAALLEPKIDRDRLACDFPASRLPATNCSRGPIVVGNTEYQPDTPSRIDRLLFLLPYEEPEQSGMLPYGNNPSVFDIIDARMLSAADPSILAGAVVVIGGSYIMSGDLHVTPLEAAMPGAMVHANAIRAYASRALLRETKSWRLKLVLTGIAALLGSIFHTLSLRVRSKLGVFSGDLARISILLVGIIVSSLAVLVVGVFWASADLAETGAVLGTLTPALAVAFEGLCGVLHELKQIVSLAPRHADFR